MRITKTKRGIAIAAASLAALGTTGAAVAATQTDSPSATSKAIVASAAQDVGVSESALTAALVKAEEAQIDAQVTAGKLTQTQADAIKKRLESGTVPLVGIGMGMGMGGRHGGPGHGGPGRNVAAVASYVGVTEATVQSELQGGKTLAQIATAHGKTVDGLVAALVSAEKTKLDAAVTSGKITQAQEDAMLVNGKQHVTDEVNGKLPSGPPFGLGGPRGPGDGTAPPAPAPDTTTSTTTTSTT